MNSPNIKRIAIGLSASVVILILLGFVPSPIPEKHADLQLFDRFYGWPGVSALVVMFVAACGGACIAKVRFMVPAVFLAVTGWAITIHFLNSIAVAAGQGDILFVASINSLGLVLGIVGAVFGAALGEKLSDNTLLATDQ